MDTIRLLVSLDERYLPQLKVLLTSAALNCPETRLDLYLLHSGIPDSAWEPFYRWSERHGGRFTPIRVGDDLFQAAPVSRQYPREMYYRLLAGELLPGTVGRVLYLDPDILVINPLRPLWELDLAGRMFAAAAHTGKTELANSVNQVRLGTNHNYYNSGVLLIDLDAARRWIDPAALFAFTKKHARELLFPDQDLLNMLYGERVLALDDAVWNYDARNFNNYYLRSGGDCDMDWVLTHTAVLHFCGKAKPWKPGYRRRFGPLYKHYMRLTQLALPD